MAPLSSPGFLGNGRSGCHRHGSELYAETNKKKITHPFRNFGLARSNPE
jgi:hypothetical protein